MRNGFWSTQGLIGWDETVPLSGLSRSSNLDPTYRGSSTTTITTPTPTSSSIRAATNNKNNNMMVMMVTPNIAIMVTTTRLIMNLHR